MPERRASAKDKLLNKAGLGKASCFDTKGIAWGKKQQRRTKEWETQEDHPQCQKKLLYCPGSARRSRTNKQGEKKGFRKEVRDPGEGVEHGKPHWNEGNLRAEQRAGARSQQKKRKTGRATILVFWEEGAKKGYAARKRDIQPLIRWFGRAFQKRRAWGS